jgi:GTPase SAR1 family protein
LLKERVKKMRTTTPTYVKATFFGPRGAGKTGLVVRIGGRRAFDPEYKPTIGMDFTRKRVSVDATPVIFTAWDYTDYNSGVVSARAGADAGAGAGAGAGSGSGCASASSFLRDRGYVRRSDVAVLVFDATSAASQREVVAWIQANDGGITDCVKALVAAKVDVVDVGFDVAVRLAEARGVASTYGWHFFETSAKNDIGIATMVDALSRAALTLRGAPVSPSVAADEAAPPSSTLPSTSWLRACVIS